MTLSFRTRIALWSVTTSGLVLLVFVIASSTLFFDNMLEEADHVLTETALELVAEETVVPDTPPATPAQNRLPTVYLSSEPARLNLIDLRAPGDEPIFRDENWPDKSRVAFPIESADRGTDHVHGVLWRIMGRNIDGYRIALALDIGEIRKEVWRMAATFLRAMPIGLLFVALGAWWIAGRAVKPVRRITDIAENITPDGLGQRVPTTDHPDEIGRIGRVLNRMMDRLEAAFKQANRFSSDASHELRTPLAVMQGKLEAALQRATSESEQKTCAELLEQVQNLKTITDSLLMFSRSDVGSLTLSLEGADLTGLVNELLEDIDADAEEREIKVSRDVAPNVKAKADTRLIRMAVFNLLQNAIKYNRPDSSGASEIHVGLTDDEFRITNTGPGIPEEDREKIFDRFYRGHATSSKEGGFGLGLSLARIIVQAHGGSIGVTESTGERTTFAIRLPK